MRVTRCVEESSGREGVSKEGDGTGMNDENKMPILEFNNKVP